MPSLPETQRAFAAALGGDEASIAALLAQLAGDADGNRRRFEAYRRNVTGNWINALRATYPVVERRLGAGVFMAAARQYSRAHPSLSGDLNDYGEAFADFLAAHPCAAEFPYLADLARLEWSVQASYYAADSVPFDFAALAAIPAARHGDLRFSLAPAFLRMRSAYPLAALWQAHQDAAVQAVDFAGGPHVAWIVRPHGRVWVEPASAADDAFVAALGGGFKLDAAIASGLAVDGSFDVGACLGRLVERGVLATFSTTGENS